MEHELLTSWAAEQHVSLEPHVRNKLLSYAGMLYETNKKFNLTGFDTIEGIIKNLIIGSIAPIIRLNVPRGTLYADIGSGGGIPGIPVGIVHDQMRGILIESNTKKALFIESVISTLKLENCSSYHGRIEEYIASGVRETCDIVFSRALGNPYAVIEWGAPLLKKDGLLYIYSNLQEDTLPVHLKDHSVRLGLSIASDDTRNKAGIETGGLLFQKTGTTEERYPRKISIIKREILKGSRSITV